MVTWGLILFFLLPFNIHSVPTFPSPLLNLGSLPPGNTSHNPAQEPILASLWHGSVHTQRVSPLGCQQLSEEG